MELSQDNFLSSAFHSTFCGTLLRSLTAPAWATSMENVPRDGPFNWGPSRKPAKPPQEVSSCFSGCVTLPRNGTDGLTPSPLPSASLCHKGFICCYELESKFLTASKTNFCSSIKTLLLYVTESAPSSFYWNSESDEDRKNWKRPDCISGGHFGAAQLMLPLLALHPASPGGCERVKGCSVPAGGTHSGAHPTAISEPSHLQSFTPEVSRATVRGKGRTAVQSPQKVTKGGEGVRYLGKATVPLPAATGMALAKRPTVLWGRVKDLKHLPPLVL